MAARSRRAATFHGKDVGNLMENRHLARLREDPQSSQSKCVLRGGETEGEVYFFSRKRNGKKHGASVGEDFNLGVPAAQRLLVGVSPADFEEILLKYEEAETKKKLYESAREEAKNNKRVHLANFIEQTLRCEACKSLTNGLRDQNLKCLRPDVFENHVAGKFARGFQSDNGSVSKDAATQENGSVASTSSGSNASDGTFKGIVGLGARYGSRVIQEIVQQRRQKLPKFWGKKETVEERSSVGSSEGGRRRIGKGLRSRPFFLLLVLLWLPMVVAGK